MRPYFLRPTSFNFEQFRRLYDFRDSNKARSGF
jgi:hypothetical protein